MKQLRWFEMFMKWCYFKSPRSTIRDVGDSKESFPSFLREARRLGLIAAKNYVSDRFFGIINRIDPPHIALDKLKQMDFADQRGWLVKTKSSSEFIKIFKAILYRLKRLFNIGKKESYDCDDFASAVIALGQKFNGYLLTYFNSTLMKSHTIPVFKVYNMFWVVDWYKSYQGDTMNELIANIEERHEVKIISVHLAKFNYTLGKYESVTEEELI